MKHIKRFVPLIPNGITLSRIGLSILFITNVIGQFMYQKDNLGMLVVVFLVICLTDFIDGRVARILHCTSATGAKLDVFADLFFIAGSSITLAWLGILPLWFCGFVLLKFTEFLATSKYTIRHRHDIGGNGLIFDKVGRTVSAMFFAVPGAACVLHVLVPGIADSLIAFLLYALLVGGLYSSCFRVNNCLWLRTSNG